MFRDEFAGSHSGLVMQTRQLQGDNDHQPPEVNYIEVLANVDFPCRVHCKVYLLGEIAVCENVDIVHLRWLEGSLMVSPNW